MRVFLLILLFLSAQVTWSQSPSFHHLNVEDGLSQNSVLCVAQDNRGFMWFGTRYGLNKYDSRKLTVYKNKPGDSSSLSSNYILSLLCDSRQTLWVGTRGGLHKYQAAKDVFERIDIGDTALWKNGNIPITCLFEDSKGRLWAGTYQTLYLMKDPEHPSFTSFTNCPNFPARGVLCVFEDRSGTIWAGTNGGLVKITAAGKGFEATVFKHDPPNAGSLSNDQVTSIAQDKQGQLWIGTLNGGLNLFDPAQNSFTHFTHSDAVPNSLINNHIRRLAFDGQDQLWIGTQEGLSTLHLPTLHFSSYINDPWNKASLSQNSVHSIYKDHAGTMWVGTFFGGVNFHFAANTDFTVYSNRSRPLLLNNNVVSGLVEDEQGHLWIGTEGGGLNFVNRQTGAVVYYQHKPSDPYSLGSNLVKTVYRDRQDNIWVGTHGGGLNRFDAATHRFIRYLYKNNDAQTLGSEIPCLLEDSRGIFWVGTEISGIKLFLKKDKELAPYPDGAGITAAIGTNKAILSLLESAGKVNWVGTSAGLYRIAGDQVTLLTEKNSSYPLYVNCLTEDSRGNIWAGTYYNGIIVYNSAGKKIAAYNEENGLPDNNVLGILQDDHTQAWWISTSNGLAKWDTVSRKFTVYTEADGLAGNVFNNNSFYKSRSGELFFGGFNGLSAFYPEMMKTNTAVQPVLLTGLKLFNKPVEINGKDGVLTEDISFTRQLKLKYDQNVFTIDFAILNFIKPQKNRYAYQLEKFDKDWNYTMAATASYTNVPPGNYTFKVRGANNDGIWSEPLLLKITVSPPFWKTWWAYGIYLLLFVTLAFFIVRFFFLRALLKRNQELTQLKLNFFTNISHEIRTHLSLIIGPAEKLILSTNNDAHDQQQLRTIKNNSESLLQLVNELMDFRKAETGHLPLRVSGWNIVPFVESIFDSFHDISISRNIRAGFISTAPDIQAWIDKEQLEKVFYNLLSNAYKFTPNGGYISVAIEEKKTTIAITVTDNGRGISEENIEKLFDNYFQEDDFGKQNTGYGIGLALSKSIVEMHQGTLTVSNKMTAGQQEPTTCFTVTLQKGHAHFADNQLVNDRMDRSAKVANHPPVPPPLVLSATSQPHAATADLNTILLVEDNAAIRTFIKEALQTQYHILESNNGLEGLASATETIPDLIISDVMMPEMDGLAFCSSIKTDTRTSHIPVILLTAKTAVTHQISGLQTGADIYLTKPFSIQVLELQIQNLLASRARLWQQFQQQWASTTLLPADNETGAPITATTTQKLPEPLHPMDASFLQEIIQMVETNMEDPEFGIAMLAKKAAMSQPVLFKKIKAITGMTANDFVKSLRLKKATLLLQENRHTVYEIAFMVGYDSSKYFSREFKKQFGKTPTEYAAMNEKKSA